LFLTEGAATVIIAFASYFVLPNFPHTTSWLSPRERALAIHRLAADVGSIDTPSKAPSSLWSGFIDAFTDPKVYILGAMQTAIVAAASVTNFFPSVVATLGFPAITTLLLTTPPYLVAVVATLVNASYADRTRRRFVHVVAPLYVAVGAFSLASWSTATPLRYAAMVFIVPSVYSAYVVGLAWISSCVPRPAAKRAAALAGINTASNAASIFTSYLYPESAAPRYRK
jgi:hypothetical protein